MAITYRLPKGPLVLASASGARQTMLRQAGLDFISRPANIDEIGVRKAAEASSMPAEEIAILLADMKARQIANDVLLGDDSTSTSGFVLGSDQILFCEGEIISKPQTFEAAVDQVAKIAGKDHQLLTAAVIYRDGERIWHHLETPKISIRALDRDFIETYVKGLGEAAFQSPGSYQIEGQGVHLFSKIHGCGYSILGMPLLQILAFLRNHGLAPEDQT
jgi:septum formation protein